MSIETLIESNPNDTDLGREIRKEFKNSNEIIKHLALSNKSPYNYLKCVEELTELSEVLMKRSLKEKSDKNPTNDAIIEEIGDVELRLEILKEMMNCHLPVFLRRQFKLKKYKEYIKDGKYLNI